MDALRSALADRYAIERELGRGGNAVVYLARDLKHDRNVALKVLLPELALAVRAERFLREIQIAAKLTHPHILPLHDSGNANGTLFYVMPYVEGESLRDRINREKQLSVEMAVGITKDVAGALAYAHVEGVVHRDVKPENILLTKGGEALVADFGIARALTVAGDGGITESGIAVGTPAYMSPEQASGGTVDPRSDLYSLGGVLYEMLAGRPPFAGSTAQEILRRHVLDPVPSVRVARRSIPATIEQTILKALAKQPADRFATAGEFIGALSKGASVPVSRRWRVARGAGFVVVVLLALTAPTLRRRLVSRVDPRSLAVMPCLPLTTDSTDVSFSEGMAAELIDNLTRIDGLTVPAFTSSLEVRSKNLPVDEAGRRLGVANVFNCQVRRAGGRLRLNAELLKASSGERLWSEMYDRELTTMSDMIALQEGLSRSIVSALRVRLTANTVVSPSTQSMAAHELYIKGRMLFIQRSPTSVPRSVQLFQDAIVLDSSYALAWAGLADAYWRVRGASTPDSIGALELAAARRAVQINPDLAEGHAAIGAAYDWIGEVDSVENEYRRAIQINSGYAWAHALYALWLTQRLRFDDGLKEAQIAYKLDPASGSINPAIAMYRARHFDEAIRVARSAVDIAPDYEGGYGQLGLSLFATGKVDEGIRMLERANALSTGNAAQKKGRLGYAYAKAGRRGDALKILVELEKGVSRQNTTAQEILAAAMVNLGLGENEKGIQLLRRPLPAGQRFNPSQIGGPEFDPIQSDPRYQAVLRRNLEPVKRTWPIARPS